MYESILEYELWYFFVPLECEVAKYCEERAEKKSGRDTIDRRHAKDEIDSRREIELICSFSSFSDSFASSSFFLQADLFRTRTEIITTLPCEEVHCCMLSSRNKE